MAMASVRPVRRGKFVMMMMMPPLLIYSFGARQGGLYNLRKYEMMRAKQGAPAPARTSPPPQKKRETTRVSISMYVQPRLPLFSPAPAPAGRVLV